ncbi:hypothetical protein [Lacicoccus qingdaonensis]|uniref:Uncharacterized protein n=1 Tax=Lacicoccus qingdaonensis TaxID=576118 RepID=A0A1G9IJ62_9BACL|nr:hypothetical protein [Salinicoccus qingdaonensis]SDL25319.1 hypothetical protein SAMN05216216_13411 [Salinicoccus qingdaonensis]
MKIQKETIEINYEKLSLEIILKANNNILKVLKENTAFYFILNE